MAKRIDVHYGSRMYTIADRELADVRREITDAVLRGSGWLLVNDGEGVAQPTELLLTPGVDISLAAIPDETG